MPAKIQRPSDKGEKSQYQRFVETAREIGTDETGDEFERLFRKAVPPKNKK
jgi:hypothetical protein